MVIHDLCTGARLIHQSFPNKIISSILLAAIPTPVLPSTSPQTPAAQGPPQPPLQATELPAVPQAVIATATGDLYFINLNNKSAVTHKLPCAVVGLWALNWRYVPSS